MNSEFRFANSTSDPSGLDILDPDGNRIAWAIGDYAVVMLRAINRYIDGDDAPEIQRLTAEVASLRVALARYREAATPECSGNEGDPWQPAAYGCLLCFEAAGSRDEIKHDPSCPLATDPAANGAAVLEAGRAMRKYGERVVRGEGTQQRYEYLMNALDAWDRALAGSAGEGR